jgi:hypothetical protein
MEFSGRLIFATENGACDVLAPTDIPAAAIYRGRGHSMSSYRQSRHWFGSRLVHKDNLGRQRSTFITDRRTFPGAHAAPPLSGRDTSGDLAMTVDDYERILLKSKLCAGLVSPQQALKKISEIDSSGELRIEVLNTCFQATQQRSRKDQFLDNVRKIVLRK